MTVSFTYKIKSAIQCPILRSKKRYQNEDAHVQHKLALFILLNLRSTYFERK